MKKSRKKRLEDSGMQVGSPAEFLALTVAERAEVRRRIDSGPTLAPPAGYSSWLAYAVATMDDRSLENDHDQRLQPQWPAKVIRAQMRSAAQAELRQIEELWSEMERAWAVTLANAETNEILSNPAAMKAIQQHKAGKTKFGKLRDI